MKLLILTTDPTVKNWRTIGSKLAYIKSTLNNGTADWEVELQDYTGVVKVAEGRLDREWYKNLVSSYFKQGNDMVALHMSDKQRKKWGIEPSLRGSNPNTGQEYGDMYFWSDEKTLREGLSQFIQTLLHEICHEYYQQTKTYDTTHLWHKANPDISGLVKSIDWRQYQPERMKLKLIKSLYEKVLELLLKKKSPKLIHPVNLYKTYISQDYGVANKKLYPKTGFHIGTDYACPTGTKLLAPFDGEVTVSNTTAVLGKYCHYQYDYNGIIYTERYLHLNSVPKLGRYSQGDLIATTGNSGLSTGSHLHQDIWRGEVRLDLIDKTNWKDLTVNPKTHYDIK